MRLYNDIRPFQKQQWTLAGCIAALCLFCSLNLQAQGWERQIGDLSDNISLEAIAQTKDDGYVSVGSIAVVGGFDIYIVRTDVDGTILWEKQLGGDGNDLAYDVMETAEGDIMILGYLGSGSTGNRDVYLARLDEDGKLKWENDYGDALNDEGYQMVQLVNGGFAIAGYSEINTNNKQWLLILTDANGNQVGNLIRGGGARDEEMLSIVQANNGNLVLAGFTEEDNNKDAYVITTDANGFFRNDIFVGGAGADDIRDMVVSPGGDIIAVGRFDGMNSNIYFLRLSADGESLINTTTIGTNQEIQFGESVINVPNGNVVITGRYQANNSPTAAPITLAEVTLSGELVWQTFVGEDSYTYDARSVVLTRNNDLVVAGSVFPDAFSGVPLGAVLKVNDQGTFFTNVINGKVSADLDNNCEPDAVPEVLSNWILTARNISTGATYYASTDDEGNYEMRAATGTYMLRLYAPNEYWVPCRDEYNLTFAGTYDTLSRDFYVSPEIACTDLSVDVSTTFLKACDAATYLVDYCNSGTLEAEDVRVELIIDNDLTVTGANVAFTQTDSLVVVQVPNVLPGDCGQFSLNVDVDCDAVINQSHCVSAHIYPDSICLPTPGWTGGSIEVNGFCDGDSVRFEIKNTGRSTIPASQNIKYIVIEDIFLRESRQPVGELPVGELTTFAFDANGDTYRIIADQAEGHPGNSKPTIAVEGCSNSGTYSVGFLTQFEEDDRDPFISKNCQENLDPNSVTANFKRGYPKGVGEDHLIVPETDLKYQINFQNTESDTAIRVVIRDTLSSFLDPTTVQPGASSHDYELEIYGEGILKFTFYDIQLVDSSSDDALSRGFVAYRVSQKPGNSAGTRIDNCAAIYLDFDAPGNTGKTFHTVEDMLVSTENIFIPQVKAIEVFPNPFNESTTIEIISELDFDDMEFQIYDLSGRLLQSQSVNGKKFNVYRNNLASGLYIYKLQTQRQLVSSGKIVIR